MAGMMRCCTRPARAAFFACLAAGTVAARAEPDAGGAGFFGDGHWRVAVSPYSLHFSPSAEHKPVRAVALERQYPDTWLWGGSYFTNSFGQSSGYVYFGQRNSVVLFPPQLYTQWTAGLMYGYRGRYQEKVPLNSNGFSPGLLLSLGWAFDPRFSAQLNLLGTAGLMLQLSYDWR
jgi:hypothetical protein